MALVELCKGINFSGSQIVTKILSLPQIYRTKRKISITCKRIFNIKNSCFLIRFLCPFDVIHARFVLCILSKSVFFKKYVCG